MLCLYVLIIAVLEEILRSKGKEKWLKPYILLYFL